MSRRCAEEHSIRSHSGTLALKTENFSKNSVILVKRKDGFAKTIPWTENLAKQGEECFSKSIFAFYYKDRFLY